MRYDSPQLRERLAAEYVLGTMPTRVRRRFERLMGADPELARVVGDWVDRLAPLDDGTPAEQPPARVWRAIESRIAGEATPTASPASVLWWLQSLTFWRGIAATASAAAVALVLYVALFTGQAPTPAVVAVLAGHGGEPGWVAVAGPKPGVVSFSAVAPAGAAKPHSFQLWGIAGGPPRPLGLLPEQLGNALTLPETQLPPPGGVLAVSFEPPGGSPTGAPTGPVLYQGKVLLRIP
jgi:anti-sigma-K factor RskA